MELTKIERYVSDLMTVSGIEKEGKEQTVGLALYHLLMSAALRDVMSDDDKELFSLLTKKLQYFFCTKLSLKERKRKTEKKNFPPNPLLKEKEKTEKEEKETEQNTAAGDAVLEGFQKECLRYVGQYGRELVEDFYFYWKQVDKETGKRLFEGKRCFDVDSQLRAWSKSEFTLSKEVAAIRLQKQKRQQDRQQAIAQERNEANDRLWQQYADMKKGAVSHEEWLASKKKTTDSTD
jgi:hypothetical protein